MNNEMLHEASLMSGISGISAAATALQRPWDPQRLTYRKPTLTNQDVLLITRSNICHKFIIYDIENYDKTAILDAMIAACSPEILLPMVYTVENPQKATFIARCTVSMIKNLLTHGLRVTMPDGRTLGMDIILGYVDINEFSVNPQKEINNALKLRYQPMKKILNLDDFQNDKSLQHVYCAISSHKIFQFIIRRCNIYNNSSASDNKLSVRELSLRSNAITGIPPLEKYFNYHLTKVDLRNNNISNIAYLGYFKDFKITELWLDGNPVCSQYTTSEDYIAAVKTIFPHVQKLDGVVIGVQMKLSPLVRMNYLGDMSRMKLIKQFIRHYFTFYDQIDRNVMSGLYDHDALFSITLGPITNSTHLQMTKAFANNRNLLKFVDYAKCHEFLLRGPQKIIAALRRQPATHHNYKKFNVDVLYYNEDSITIAVQGSFCYKEYPYATLLFNRTFVIVELEDNEYCIANDQYHIQSEPSSAKIIVRETRPGAINAAPKIQPAIFSRMEKHQLLTFFGERTTMNEKYCRHYLDNANWDIRVALEAFIKSYTRNDIPSDAFRRYAHS